MRFESMGPRKKSKPNPKAEAEREAQAVTKPSSTEVHTQQPAVPCNGDITPAKSTTSDVTNTIVTKPSTISTTTGNDIRETSTEIAQPQAGKSWYRGSWPKKSTPITQVAKESISAASGAASEAVASARAHTAQLPSTPHKSPVVYLQRSVGSSSRSLPLSATTTNLNVSPNTLNLPQDAASETRPAKADTANLKQKSQWNVEGASAAKKSEDQASDLAKSASPDTGKELKSNPEDRTNHDRESTSWLNWFSKPAPLTDPTRVLQTDDKVLEKTSEVCEAPSPTTTNDVSQDVNTPLAKPRSNSEPGPISPVKQQEPAPRSWLGFWGNTTTQRQSNESVDTAPTAVDAKECSQPSQASKPTEPEPEPETTPQPDYKLADGGKSYGWAFWSKDKPDGDGGKSAAESKSGELAQAGSASQKKPEKASVDESAGVPNKVEKRRRPQSADLEGTVKKTASVDGTDNKDITGAKSPSTPKGMSAAEKSLTAKREDLVLPPLKSTYSIDTRPGLIQQISRLIQLGSSLEPKHVKINPNPHRIKKALAIGIHGYFPAPLIRSVLGKPTGTSIRFANNAAKAIEKWTHDQGYSCEIEKVALEGEGKIAERTNLLWDLLLNWIEKIRQADFVMIACHSQGVPVGIMLVQKLVAMGCVSHAKIGVCAMAGVNLGPFADYKSRWISGSAGELFDFARHNSQVSRDYEEALHVALKFGVKVVYIGSIDDQLVSLDVSRQSRFAGYSD